MDTGLREAIKREGRQLWKDGYQTAVDALRGMQGDFEEEQIRSLIGMLADTLERIKPRNHGQLSKDVT